MSKAAPLAIARTKSTMSFRSDGFFAKAQRWFSPDGTETPATRTPVTRSAAASRRSSFDRSDSMVQTGTPPKDSPVIAPRIEDGGDIAVNGLRDEDEQDKHARFPRATVSDDGFRTPRREESPAGRPHAAELERIREGANGGATTPTQLKVEFSLPP